uniref:Possible regulator pra-like protein n=1 Tax=Micromonospora rosaria TaxID=47874 RepID=Q58SY8_9ACTN|nr:possible regulator pra-like protein [Micromonospora rosaria]
MFVPDSIAEAQDFNEATRQRTPSKDKVTGERVWQCRVMDMDPELGSRSREVSIKILSNVQPVPPVGPFQQVEFENLTVTPYVGSNGRLAYSFRATGIVAPKTLTETRGKAS